MTEPSAQQAPAQIWCVETPLRPDEILQILQQRARRGKLAEFAKGPLGRHSGDFSVDAAASPFDHRLIGSFSRSEGTTRITFRLVRLAKIPALFVAVLAITVWPGVWLTDSMLSVYFDWYAGWTQSMPWLTYAWYLPLTAGPIPWIWRKVTRTSREQAVASAQEMVGAIDEELKSAARA